MAARIRKVDYFSMKVPNRAGAASRLLEVMRAEGVNLLAFTGFPAGGGSQVDFVPERSAVFRRAARKAGWRISTRKTAFLAQGEDRVGALTSLLAKLAKARINLTALEAITAGKRRYGAIFWVRKAAVARTARLLRAR